MGTRGKVLPVRGTEWGSLACRSVRRALSADRLSLHVRARLGRGVQVMLFLGRQFQWHPIHLNHRDVTLTAVSRAPWAKINAYRKRMGWSFPWVSSYGSDFNFDYHVSFTPEQI